MNNINRLIIFFPFVILGCAPNVIEEYKVIQKIDSLDMNIFSKRGDKIFSITSPYSSYDNNDLKFELKNTTIDIFNGEETKYIIYSDESTLSEKNKLLQLNGNVKLKTLKLDEDILYADNFSWNIEGSNYLLEGNIRFENKNIILSSAKAILDSDNIIEFFNPVKYIIKDDSNENKYEIKSENAYYNLETESVTFKAKDKRVRSTIYF
ncbi:MAG: LPS export ABC transporter periplasmic protein LptC [Prochlorococcus marinus CUG1439]|uniref:LPS export ABC transporter periplasmic protein LptC n=1 Tax=Prochlorococcus sp. MIT 1314 TaxID=3096220 RepID=UPI002A600749|nr:LPS export ABC transporter periplasmic protein LptC [Prochlorococcus sp. MIT 1314]MCR8540257.1 LPS export ABC transporter periplasmic protein LptC [Prochlorococcus marinus CUG1439]